MSECRPIQQKGFMAAGAGEEPPASFFRRMSGETALKIKYPVRKRKNHGSSGK